MTINSNEYPVVVESGTKRGAVRVVGTLPDPLSNESALRLARAIQKVAENHDSKLSVSLTLVLSKPE